jgi:hypothetical protein
MAETTLLRSSAIVRNATVAPPQHGPVKTGALPLVQVRMSPGGPQVQDGQQKAVVILPPRDAKSAVAIGGLPMVQVKMTQNGPQIDDGRDQPVLIKNGKQQGSANAGGLPMVQVRMDGGKPQVQTIPNVQGGPPRIPAALPALSQQRGTPVARQGYVARVAAPTANQGTVARIAAPQAPLPQAVLPSVPEMSTDQLMLCHHRVTAYLNDLVAADHPTEPPTEARVESDIVKLARETIANIDEILVATAVRDEAVALAAAAAQAAPAVAAVPSTQSFAAATSIAPTPSASYVAGRVTRPQQGYTGGVRSQRNSGMAPRRVVRSGPPLPPVIVKMDGRQPVVQSAPVPPPAPEPVAEEVVVEVMMAQPPSADATSSTAPNATDAQG